MPPTIHGVRRPPRSEPWPQRRPEHLQGIVNGDQQRPGRIAGIASSTTITRFSVDVVRTTIGAEAGLNQAEPDDAEPGEQRLFMVSPPGSLPAQRR